MNHYTPDIVVPTLLEDELLVQQTAVIVITDGCYFFTLMQQQCRLLLSHLDRSKRKHSVRCNGWMDFLRQVSSPLKQISMMFGNELKHFADRKVET